VIATPTLLLCQNELYNVSVMNHSYNSRNSTSRIQSHSSYIEPHECYMFLHCVQICDYVKCSMSILFLITWACPYKTGHDDAKLLRLSIIYKIMYNIFVIWIFFHNCCQWKIYFILLEWIAEICYPLCTKVHREHRTWNQTVWRLVSHQCQIELFLNYSQCIHNTSRDILF
jgi:hypothetical protein